MLELANCATRSCRMMPSTIYAETRSWLPGWSGILNGVGYGESFGIRCLIVRWQRFWGPTAPWMAE